MGFRVLAAAMVVMTAAANYHNPEPQAPQRPQVSTSPAAGEDGVRRGMHDNARLVNGLLAATRRAQSAPVVVTGRRYSEQGAFARDEIRAEAFRVSLTPGEQLRVALPRVAPGPDSLRVKLYRAAKDGWQQLEELDPSTGVAAITAQKAQDYLVLLHPEVAETVSYQLEISRGGSLLFPVAGAGLDRIWSYFGDRRGGGTRLHEGVDVFMDRGAPVHAVTSGYVRTDQTLHGGNVVWLMKPGSAMKYYYAHLDTIAVPDRVWVEAGRLLGTVGNTGNARNTPSHLHFGIYHAGHGAVDPLPFLQPAPAAGFLMADLLDRNPPVPGPREVIVDQLRLRAAPSRKANLIDTLPDGSVVQVVAATAGPWKRVHLGDGRSGFVHRDWLAPANANATLAHNARGLRE
ncbi:MAG: M23 family metallopeptidase [Aquisalimonadaceae bacterium]